MDPSRSDASSPPLLADRQLTQHNPPSTVEIESSPLSSDLQFALSLSYYSSLFLTGLASIALIVNLFLLCVSLDWIIAEILAKYRFVTEFFP